MPLKPDGTHYQLASTVRNVTEDSYGTLISSFWAGYESAITLKVWTASVGAPVVLDTFIYPGDFIITCIADKAGWGFIRYRIVPFDSDSAAQLP